MKTSNGNCRYPIDYINVHGTSTPVGDVKEFRCNQNVFGDKSQRFLPTKSMTGHSLGAAGAHEAIYTLLMLIMIFIAPSINIETLDGKPLKVATSLLGRKVMQDYKLSCQTAFGFVVVQMRH